MKTFNELMLEVAEPKAGDEKRFKAKHVIKKYMDRTGNGDDVYNASNIKADRSRAADRKEDDELVYESKTFMQFESEIFFDKEAKELIESALVFEEKMSDAEMKKREKIVLSMKDKMGEFKKRYGSRAKAVMYATATKMATD